MVMKLNGDRMKQILSQVAKDEYDLRVNDLYDFCFGDFYTRSGLSLKDRELMVLVQLLPWEAAKLSCAVISEQISAKVQQKRSWSTR